METKGGNAMRAPSSGECCPRFDPGLWEESEFTWEGKRFVKDRVISFFHIPLNFGAVMKRNVELIERTGAWPEQRLVLSDENSLWGADVYVEVSKDIPGARMATISGSFLSKVFEGPFGNISRWIEEMKRFVQSKGKAVERLYFFYTTCPKCAKLHGKNYVVILAQI
jgi:hypothetical protein